MRTSRRISCLVASAVAALTALPVAGAPRLLLYAGFEDTTQAAYSVGVGMAALGGGSDVLLHLHGTDFTSGRRGRGVSLKHAGLYYPARGNFSEEAGTLVAWIRPNWSGADTNKYATIFGVQGWGLFYKYTDQSYLTFAITKSDGYFDYGCTASIADWQPGQWHQVAITWDLKAGRRCIYVDGKLGGEGKIPSSHAGLASVAVGCTPGGANSVDGTLDELYIWSEPLPADEIAGAYARGNQGERCWPIPPRPAPPPPVPAAQAALPSEVNWALADAPRRRTATRERISLNGFWRFQPLEAPTSEPPRTGWGYFRVPGSWGVRDYEVRDALFRSTKDKWQGRPVGEFMFAWYEREFTPPNEWGRSTPRRRVTLGLDSVRALGTVFLNGEQIGKALEYEPARFDVTARLRYGEKNTLSVLVQALRAGAEGRGLDEDVWLELGPPVGSPQVGAIFVRPSVAKSRLVVVADVGPGEAVGQLQLAAEVLEPGQEQPIHSFTSQPVELGASGGSLTAVLPWRDARLWSPEDPFLYELRLRLQSADGRLLDEAEPITFGFREFAIRGGDFTLNGVKTHLKGQSSPPLYLYSFNAHEENIRAWFEKLRSVGVYAVREYSRWTTGKACHYRDKAYRVADEMGMLILPHAPGVQNLWRSWDRPGVREGLKRRLRQYVARYGNHACAVMWMQNFNLAAYTGDICPDWIDGSYVYEDESLAQRRRVALEGQALLEAVDGGTRPVFHHACGDLGDVYSTMTYLDFGTPLQSREEWPLKWTRKRRKPLLVVETGFPVILSWYRERRWSTGLDVVYASECLATQYSAAYLGDRAYANVTPEEAEVLATNRWSERIDFLRTASANYRQMKALWGERNLRSWRGYGLSGYCLHVEVRECFDYATRELELPEADPREFGLQTDHPPTTVSTVAGYTPLGQSLRRANMPVLVYISGPEQRFVTKDHAFYSGRKVVKQALVVNDTYQRLDLELGWQARDEDGHKIARGRGELRIPPGEQRALPIEFAAPEVKQKTRCKLTLAAASRNRNWQDEFRFEVFPPRKAIKVQGGSVALLDREGKLRSILRRAKVKVSKLRPESDLRQFHLLLIGRKSLNSNTRALLEQAHLREALAGGLRVLCLEQEGRSVSGLRWDDPYARNVFIRRPNHPVLAGLSNEDFRDWRGASDLTKAYPTYTMPDPARWPDEFYHWSNNGVVCSFAAEKPQAGRFAVLLDCGFDQLYTPLVECLVGEGRLILCQLDLTNRYGRDPVATLLLRRLISYLDAAPTPGSFPWAYVGGTRGRELLGTLGIAAESAGDEDWRQKPVLVLDPEAAVTPAQLRAWALPTRAALILCLGSERLPGYLPFSATLRRARVFGSVWEQPPPPLCRGLAPSDFYWRVPRDYQVLNEADGLLWASDPPTVAVVELNQAQFILFLPRPDQFDDARERTKTRRALATILSNLGLPSRRGPDLLLDSVPEAGETSPYLEPALDFNPHQYRRW